ncbi:CCE_0567 family metalloprotein [uncultured Amphritea sp.]|uniref:CCE_0567 family metalloprotein n=1 Tax=uncultured Amphritea sp. TaxID=981605 RepID=UPI002607C20D|nr:CCE_0567 family metalloprotein [uncultured Amphritea sp.]
MTDDALKGLQKDARKAKRIATEWASQMHDLVEDQLWTDYERLPELADKTLAACLAWKEAQEKLDAVQQ